MSYEYSEIFNAFFPAKITAKENIEGRWHYTWIEQTWNVDDGTFMVAAPSRSGSATLSPAFDITS